MLGLTIKWIDFRELFRSWERREGEGEGNMPFLEYKRYNQPGNPLIHMHDVGMVHDLWYHVVLSWQNLGYALHDDFKSTYTSIHCWKTDACCSMHETRVHYTFYQKVLPKHNRIFIQGFSTPEVDFPFLEFHGTCTCIYVGSRNQMSYMYTPPIFYPSR